MILVKNKISEIFLIIHKKILKREVLHHLMKIKKQ